MSLESFDINNVGPISSASCRNVPPITIVAGPNGVGKSTLFKYIADEVGSDNTQQRGNGVVADANSIYLSPHRAPSQGNMDDSILMQSLDRDYSDALQTSYSFSDQPINSDSLPYNRPHLTRTRSSKEADFAAYFEMKKQLAELRSARESIATDIMDREGSVSREEVPDITEEISLAVDYLLPGVQFDGIEKESGTYKLYFCNRDGTTVEFDDLSSGERDAIAIAFPFINRRLASGIAEASDSAYSGDDIVLLIDSPEAYLHPSLQERFLEYCRREINRHREAETWNVQVMICIHSQMILENASEDELFFLYYSDDLPEGESNQFVSAEGLSKDLIDTISGELGFAALSTGKPLLLVEGKSDKKLLRKIHRNLEVDVEIVPMGGKSSIRGLNRAFNELLPQLSTMGVEVHAIVDRDRDWNLDERVENRVFILPVTCIENLLLSDSILYSAINTLADENRIREYSLNSSDDIERIVVQIIESDRFTRKELEKRIGKRLSIHVDLTSVEEFTEEQVIDAVNKAVDTKMSRIGRTITDAREKLSTAVEERALGELDGKLILRMISVNFDIPLKMLRRSLAERQSKDNLPPEYREFIQGVREQ